MSDEDTVVLLEKNKKSIVNETKTDHIEEICRSINGKELLSNFQKSFCSLATIMSGIIFGFDAGMTSNLSKPISSLMNLSCTQHFYIVHSWVLGAFFATIFGGYLIDSLGRRASIILSMILTLIGSLLSIPNLFNIAHVFLISRFISGFAGPMSTIAQCIYISEISEPQSRGYRISLHQLGMAIGGLLVCIPLFFDANNPECWRFFKQVLWTLTCWVIFITIFFVPSLNHSLIEEQAKTDKKVNKGVKTEVLMETFGLALFLVEVQQLCGHYTVLYYAPRLYSLLGICASEAVKVTITTSSMIKIFVISICLYLVDRIGRRPLIIMSSTIMMTSLSLLALLASLDDFEITTYMFYHGNCDHLTIPGSNTLSSHNIETVRPENPDAPWALPKSPPPFPMLPTPLSLISPHQNNCLESKVESALSFELRIVGVITVILYQIADGIGYGTVVWVIVSEILPAAIRGRSLCVVAVIHWMNIGLPNIFIQLGSTIGSSFLIYSFICLISIIITYLYMPETKNKSLNQIEEDFRLIPLLSRSRENLQGLPFFKSSKYFSCRVPINDSTII